MDELGKTFPVDILHYRLIFNLGKSWQKNEISKKNLLKVVKFRFD